MTIEQVLRELNSNTVALLAIAATMYLWRRNQQLRDELEKCRIAKAREEQEAIERDAKLK